MKTIIKLLPFFLILFSCTETQNKNKKAPSKTEKSQPKKLPAKNILVVETVKKYGPEISPTYEKAVCTELVIQIIEKIQPLEDVDKKRIRIITEENIQELLKENSPIPKGVFYALTEKEIGFAVEKEEVLEGDFVQFWTETWGHCGIVKSINLDKKEMELYSSFPSTKGYGIQKFSIPEHVFFVRLK